MLRGWPTSVYYEELKAGAWQRSNKNGGRHAGRGAHSGQYEKGTGMRLPSVDR